MIGNINVAKRFLAQVILEKAVRTQTYKKLTVTIEMQGAYRRIVNAQRLEEIDGIKNNAIISTMYQQVSTSHPKTSIRRLNDTRDTIVGNVILAIKRSETIERTRMITHLKASTYKKAPLVAITIDKRHIITRMTNNTPRRFDFKIVDILTGGCARKIGYIYIARNLACGNIDACHTATTMTDEKRPLTIIHTRTDYIRKA